MFRFILVVLLMKYAFCDAQLYIPPNPCPSVFNYYYEPDSNIFGVINVPSDGSNVHRMEVNVSYMGIFDEKTRPTLRLVLTNPTNSLSNARQLTYKLSFTRQDIIPRITQIKYNDAVYCMGPSAPMTMAGVSSLWVYKESRQPRLFSESSMNRPSRTDSSSSIPPFIPPRTTTVLPWKTPATEVFTEANHGPIPISSISKPTNDHQCGIRTDPKAVDLITGGINAEANEFPWLAALYEWKNLNYYFRCTANLVDRTHVVTVASCLKFYNSYLINPHEIVLVFGVQNLRHWASESDSVIRRVERVDTNPEYTQYSAHGDLAVLTLDQPVDYSSAIRPICLCNTATSTDTADLVGSIGTVAGWGKDDRPKEFISDVKKLHMPVVAENICQASNPEFSKLISKKTFCAGEKNGKGPCTGDIGSPFMLEFDGKLQLRGMVSQAIVKRKASHCNLDDYVVFTDVCKYTEWIMRFL